MTDNDTTALITMILGVGVDIVAISRIERLIEKPRFLERLFTEKERERFEHIGYIPQTIAGVFAAKEAVSKALGTGFSGFGMRDIEILPDEYGAPHASLYGGALARFSHIGGAAIHLSISHERTHAIAMAVLEGGQ